MNPEIGQHVKCILKNNIIAEGIVEIWSVNGAKLKSLGDESFIIIPRPQEDILLIKIFQQHSLPVKEEKKPIQNELEEQFQKTYNKPSNDSLRNKSLAELKVLMNEQERQNLADKLKNHHIGEVKRVVYGQPGFLPKSSVK